MALSKIDIADVDGLTTALANGTGAAIPLTQKGSPSGVATLDSSALVPPGQLPIATTSANGVLSAADKLKLNGIAVGATANSTDAQLRDRTSHTGVQAISTVAGLQTALDGKQPNLAFTPLNAASNLSDLASAATARTNLGLGTAATAASSAFATAAQGVAADSAVPSSQKAAANGVATLDASTLIPVAQIPATIARLTQVTASQVGNTTALWNAFQLQGRGLSATAPTTGQALVWNSSTSLWEPGTAAAGGSNATQIQGVNVLSTAPTGNQSLVYSSGNSRYEPVSILTAAQRGAASGVASLDASSLILPAQIPSTIARLTDIPAQLPIGSPEGLTLSYVSATSISVSAGRALVIGTSRVIAVLGSSFTKSLNAVWAAGSGNGGRFSGTVAANQTWHVFLMYNNSTGAIDVGFDSSVTAANIPSGWSGRIIGSIMTDSSNNIRSFIQNGDQFQWANSVLDYNSSAGSTVTTNLVTLTTPLGVATTAFGRMGTSNVSTSTAINASTPGIVADAIIYYGPNIFGIGRFELVTNTSSQIICYSTNANSTMQVNTWGFYHPRGAY